MEASSRRFIFIVVLPRWTMQRIYRFSLSISLLARMRIQYSLRKSYQVSASSMPTSPQLSPTSRQLVPGFRKHLAHSLRHTKALAANHQFNSTQATATQPLEETDPAGLVFFHAIGRARSL